MKTFNEFLEPLSEATVADLQRMGASAEQIQKLKQRQAQRGKGFSSGDSRVEKSKPVSGNQKMLPPAGGALVKSVGGGLAKTKPGGSIVKAKPGGSLVKPKPGASVAKPPTEKPAKPTKPKKRKPFKLRLPKTKTALDVATSGDLEGPGRGIYNPTK